MHIFSFFLFASLSLPLWSCASTPEDDGKVAAPTWIDSINQAKDNCGDTETIELEDKLGASTTVSYKLVPGSEAFWMHCEGFNCSIVQAPEYEDEKGSKLLYPLMGKKTVPIREIFSTNPEQPMSMRSAAWRTSVLHRAQMEAFASGAAILSDFKKEIETYKSFRKGQKINRQHTDPSGRTRTFEANLKAILQFEHPLEHSVMDHSDEKDDEHIAGESKSKIPIEEFNAEWKLYKEQLIKIQGVGFYQNTERKLDPLKQKLIDMLNVELKHEKPVLQTVVSLREEIKDVSNILVYPCKAKTYISEHDLLAMQLTKVFQSVIRKALAFPARAIWQATLRASAESGGESSADAKAKPDLGATLDAAFLAMKKANLIEDDRGLGKILFDHITQYRVENLRGVAGVLLEGLLEHPEFERALPDLGEKLTRKLLSEIQSVAYRGQPVLWEHTVHEILNLGFWHLEHKLSSQFRTLYRASVDVHNKITSRTPLSSGDVDGLRKAVNELVGEINKLQDEALGQHVAKELRTLLPKPRRVVTVFVLEGPDFDANTSKKKGAPDKMKLEIVDAAALEAAS
jgi:hypothetical protein